jgi:hypothetical protein
MASFPVLNRVYVHLTRLSVRLNTCKLKYLVGNNWFLEWLCSVLGANLSIAHRLFLGRTNIARETLVVHV